MRILGVDYGRARVGIAMSDPTAYLAQAYRVIPRRSDRQVAEDISQIVFAEAVSEIVIGLPKNMNGSIGERAMQCQAFADLMKSMVDIPVVLYDERLTTVAAERTLIHADVRRAKRKQVIDEVAATILLQSYLDAKRNQSEDAHD